MANPVVNISWEDLIFGPVLAQGPLRSDESQPSGSQALGHSELSALASTSNLEPTAYQLDHGDTTEFSLGSESAVFTTQPFVPFHGMNLPLHDTGVTTVRVVYTIVHLINYGITRLRLHTMRKILAVWVQFGAARCHKVSSTCFSAINLISLLISISNCT